MYGFPTNTEFRGHRRIAIHYMFLNILKYISSELCNTMQRSMCDKNGEYGNRLKSVLVEEEVRTPHSKSKYHVCSF